MKPISESTLPCILVYYALTIVYYKEMSKKFTAYFFPEGMRFIPDLRQFIRHARQQERDQFMKVGVPKVKTITIEW